VRAAAFVDSGVFPVRAGTAGVSAAQAAAGSLGEGGAGIVEAA